MRKFQLLSLLLLLGVMTHAQNTLIPAPVSYEYTDGLFMIDPQTVLQVPTNNAELAVAINDFKQFLSQNGINIKEKNDAVASQNQHVISLVLLSPNNETLGTEGYHLAISDIELKIEANTAAGIFYGIQTLKQLMPAEFLSKNEGMGGLAMIQGCDIVDYPRFGWRGLMLDVSRHFFSVDEVKEYIDKMAEYKFNVLHWHLTDDEGWRIEIKSLPKLTEVGAWRVERNGRFGDGRPYPKEGEEATYGGFYTQEQIKDVVAYAAAKQITIVPEIDIPGHSMAALAAYPELSTLKQPKFVNPGSKFAEWYGDGKFEMLIENTLNPADEKVYDFVDKVMTEVAELFPGSFIHMGGDECYHGFWEKDPKVQKFMKKNKIADTHELQSYFVKRVEKIISSKGKKLIGWDEILEGGLADGAAVMSWRGMKGGIEAAKMGHQVVMSPTTFAYIDYMQGDASVENKIYSSLSLAKTFSFEPVPADVDEKYILGGQANLWTEVIPSISFAMYMTYPRALAIAEKVWSPKDLRTYPDFVNRVETHFRRFDVAGVSISKAIYDPIVDVKKVDDKFICELSKDVANAEIYFSTDNTYPVNYSQKYTAPFEIPEGDFSLRTQLFRNGTALGRELIIKREDLIKRAK